MNTKALPAADQIPTTDLCEKLSEFADQQLIELYHANREDGSGELALVAVGGYGRRELAPHSDIDIAFIPLLQDDAPTERFVRTLFRLIIDRFAQMEWPVGYAYRLLADLPVLDSVSRSALMDARLVCGSTEAWENFHERFWSTLPQAEFLIDKIEERSRLHTKWHGTPHVAEPHLRDGVGGLRDYQTARWISQAANQGVPAQPEKEHTFLLEVRNALHLAAHKKQDQLVGAKREQTAEILGITRDELLERLFHSAQTIFAHYEQTVFSTLKSRIVLAENARAENGVCIIAKNCTVEDAAQAVARAVRLGIRIEPCETGGAVRDPARLTQILAGGAEVCRALRKAGLLRFILPELERGFAKVADDSVHRYTIGEHTFRLLEFLDRSKNDERMAEVWSEITNHRPLYLSALLHDVGKTVSKFDHESAGAEIGSQVCERLGVSQDETQTVQWLIQNHQTMGRIARTHDLAHLPTLAEFAAFCARRDRMAMLYLLTLADISAVNDDVLTPHMRSSLAELYRNSLPLIETSQQWANDPAAYRVDFKMKQRFRGSRPLDAASEAHVQSMPTHYVLSTPVELFPLHAEYVQKARNGDCIIVFQSRLDMRMSELTVCMRDLKEPGLLSRILGILYAHDVNLHSVRAASTLGDDPVALDTLLVSYQNMVVPDAICASIASDIKSSARDLQKTNELITKLGKDPDRVQTMFTYTFQEGTPAVLEIETPPGRGMPYRISKMLADHGWNVQVARIGLWAGRAIARFYLELPGGQTLTAAEVAQALSAAQS